MKRMEHSRTMRSLYLGLLVLCVSTGVVCREIKIHGLGAKGAVPDEYMVTISTRKLREGAQSYSARKQEAAHEFKQYISENVPKDSNNGVKDYWIFPNYVMLHVFLTEDYVPLLQSHPLVSLVETNYVYRIAYNVTLNNTLEVDANVTFDGRTCLLQDTGESLWGLSRISTRDKVSGT